METVRLLWRCSVFLRPESLLNSHSSCLVPSGTINFREFLTGLSVFCPSASHQEKLKFSFDIYDKNRDGSIAKEELQEMLEATLLESSSGLSKQQVAALIEATFLEADTNGDGEISFDE
jgi:serine/threonine-protein phosphatase 2B regulatory subunit